MTPQTVAIHNKNGKGLLREIFRHKEVHLIVAIHNKNGQGLLLVYIDVQHRNNFIVAIHNKNGQGLLLRCVDAVHKNPEGGRNPQ